MMTGYARLIAKFYLLFLPFMIFICFKVQGEENQENKTVLLAILARNKAHILPQFFNCIENLDYNKKLISIYVNTNNNEDNTKEMIENWLKRNGALYNQVIFDSHEIQSLSSTKPHEWTSERFKILGEIRNKSLKKAKEYKNDYYFVIDCDNFIAPFTLKELISKEKPIIAPLLRAIPESNDPYSNYFCDITAKGYYKDHPDYMKILNHQKVGTFRVPVVHCTYLIDTRYLDKLSYIDETNDYEFVIFSRNARQNHVDQYICNEKEFGTLLHFHEDVSLEEEKKRVQDIKIALSN